MSLKTGSRRAFLGSLHLGYEIHPLDGHVALENRRFNLGRVNFEILSRSIQEFSNSQNLYDAVHDDNDAFFLFRPLAYFFAVVIEGQTGRSQIHNNDLSEQKITNLRNLRNSLREGFGNLVKIPNALSPVQAADYVIGVLLTRDNLKDIKRFFSVEKSTSGRVLTSQHNGEAIERSFNSSSDIAENLASYFVYFSKLSSAQSRVANEVLGNLLSRGSIEVQNPQAAPLQGQTQENSNSI
ncbi:MAG: hypothetical protein EBS06_09600 [Proteobacteria bacterium]|nr:hypothetical protein [Pseudomonadota bacterium]